MKNLKQAFILITLLSLIACGNSNNISPSAQQFIDENEIKPTDLSTLEVEEEEKIQIDQVRVIDSLLFEKSIFKEYGCGRDFWFDRKGPECFCDDILAIYSETIKGLKPKKISVINAKDPLLKKCREKMKGWGSRFDKITNPPPKDDLPPSIDPGI